MIKHQLGFESDWECDAGSGWSEETVEAPTKEVKKMGEDVDFPWQIN